jgi:hypothetical protein
MKRFHVDAFEKIEFFVNNVLKRKGDEYKYDKMKLV